MIMSATIDPAKLKVVELRQELSARKLDTKGNKAVLVKRLKDALEKELEQEIPDTSIADTSTEDFNASQTEDSQPEITSPRKDASPVPESPEKKTEVEPESEPEKMETTTTETVEEEEEQHQEPPEKIEEAAQELPEEEKTPEISTTEEPTCEENGEKAHENDEQEEPPVVNKSRLSEDAENQDGESKSQDTESKNQDGPDRTAAESENESRSEKRKRSSPSPSRSQRRRSKSPVKEDEPVIDNNKVQLNWYDSDLHLQVDKESFLSARPYHDGAFGYVWAGVRATHGADSGKVCFEVKIIEELKWEDNIKPPERGRRERDRKDSKRDRSDRDRKSESDDKKKNKNGKKTQEKQPDEDKAAAEAEDNKEGAETKAEPESQDVENVENILETAEAKSEEEKSEVKEATAAADMNMDEDAPSKTETEDGENGMQEGADVEAKTAEIKSEESLMEVDDAKPKQDGKEKDGLPPIPPHLIRIGWSVMNTSLQLGEQKYSYAFESSGKFVTDRQFSEYGRTFGSGDVIGAFVEFADDSVKLIFTINGEKLPEAVSTPRSELPEGFALFPHILSRNYVFEVNLGDREEPWFANPAELVDFVYLDKLENKIAGPLRPETRSECEVIMMCGLPAAGKTHWVREYVKENNEKSYTVIGTTHLLDRMTVNGNPLKINLRGRWNILLDRLTKSLNKLVEVAALRRRNYIIDQTNVFPSAQRRKMRSFEGFKRRAVIVVCGDEEQAKRQALQEAQDGKDVPDIAVLEMKANMSLPRVGDWLEEVTYVELNEKDAKAMIQKYNSQGKEAGYGPTMQRRDHRDDRFNKWQGNRRNDYRGNYRDRGYSNRFDRGQKYGGGWQNRNVSWGRNDRRDSRGGQMSGGSRDWHSRGSGPRHQDRGRDRDNNRHVSRDSYNRSRNQSVSRNQGSNWQGGGSNWGGQDSNWNNWQSHGGGNWGGQGWGQTQGQGKWNYNQGYSQQSYGSYPNWNYYGQYQNWNAQQGQAQQTMASGTVATSSGNAQAWAQYAQQYAQSNTGQQQTGQK